MYVIVFGVDSGQIGIRRQRCCDVDAGCRRNRGMGARFLFANKSKNDNFFFPARRCLTTTIWLIKLLIEFAIARFCVFPRFQQALHYSLRFRPPAAVLLRGAWRRS